MNIVRISSHYHDAAACLLKDGVLVAAAQQERFSRRKNDPRFPLNAVQYCLEEGDLSISDIDCVAYYEDPIKKLERQVWSRLPWFRPSGKRSTRVKPQRPRHEPPAPRRFRP